jgi:hypothetical protein
VFKTPTNSADTPCSSSFTPTGMRADTEFVRIHTHPFAPGDSTPSTCWEDSTPTTYATPLGGPSLPDWQSLSGFNAWGVIYDSSNVYVYRSPPSVTFDTVTTNGVSHVVPNGSQSQVRKYPRKTSICSVF